VLQKIVREEKITSDDAGVDIFAALLPTAARLYTWSWFSKFLLEYEMAAI
jgi:hypothetical protein